MHYEGNMIRPPSEADSILLQATVGCTHNKCAFCGAYQGQPFRLKPWDIVEADIEFAARHCTRQRRLFLCDGDVLSLAQPKLLRILERIRERLPWVTRVSSYGNARGLEKKSPAQLRELKEHGLGMIYMGLESGDEATLRAMRKGATASQIIEQGRCVRAAGLKLNVTVILGLAGPEESQVHAEATGKALSAMDPEQAAALTLMLVPGTDLYAAHARGDFVLPGPEAMLAELRTLIAHTDLTRGLFLANHASNYLPVRARFPRDKASVLESIDRALAGETALRPEWSRGL